MNNLLHLAPVALLASLVCLEPQESKPAPNAAVVPVPRTDEGILERQAEVLRRARSTA